MAHATGTNMCKYVLLGSNVRSRRLDHLDASGLDSSCKNRRRRCTIRVAKNEESPTGGMGLSVVCQVANLGRRRRFARRNQLRCLITLPPHPSPVIVPAAQVLLTVSWVHGCRRERPRPMGTAPRIRRPLPPARSPAPRGSVASRRIGCRVGLQQLRRCLGFAVVVQLAPRRQLLVRGLGARR